MTRQKLTALYDRFGAPGFALLALLAVLMTLYAGPGSIGLSDNGDFFRVMDLVLLLCCAGVPAADGLVLFQTSDALHGVRPVIRIRLSE